MLKKLTLVLCSVFLFSLSVVSLSVAGGNHKQGQQLEGLKKKAFKFCPSCHCCPCCPLYQASITKLDDLLTKYEKAADNKKDPIKKDIYKVIESSLDKEMEKKKEKIAKLQESISKYEGKRAEGIEGQVDFLTSDKGRQKIHKKKAEIDKQNKKHKK
jgi:hypothetical protein